MAPHHAALDSLLSSYLYDGHDASDELVHVAGEVGADDVEGGVQVDARLGDH